MARGPWRRHTSPCTAAMALGCCGCKTNLSKQCTSTGFAGLKFLQHGQRHLEEAYITVYGGYGTRLLRLQNELIQALDKHRRGHVDIFPKHCSMTFWKSGWRTTSSRWSFLSARSPWMGRRTLINSASEFIFSSFEDRGRT